MAPWTPLLVTALLLACGDKDGDDTGGNDGGAQDGGGTDGGGTDGGGDGGGSEVPDQDDDGYPRGEDCVDTDPMVNPGMPEICNGVDDNCDGVTDLDATDAVAVYEDVDGDGYGNPLASIMACEGTIPPDYVSDNGDCRDSDPTINPGGQEICDDTDLDQDCDGLREDADDTVSTLSMSTFFADYDLDGFGDPGTLVQGCDEGGVRSLNELDCDDSTAEIGPDSSCSPFDGVWSGLTAFEVEGIYGSGECETMGSVTISDRSSTQVTGSMICSYSHSYPVTLTLLGSIDYPWGVSGYWTDEQDWFYEDETWLTEFTGTFSDDGSTLILDLYGARDDLFGRYDVSLEGTWTLEP